MKSGSSIHSSLKNIVKLSEPVLQISPEESVCTTLEWANSELLAVGLANGWVVAGLNLL